MASLHPSSRIARRLVIAVLALSTALGPGVVSAATSDVRTAIASGDCKAAGDAVNAGITRNDPEALYFAGYLYDATGCVADDPVRAAHFFRRAAELGNADAATALGTLYGLGRGVARDYAEAYRWFTAGTRPAGAAAAPSDAAQAVAAGYSMTVARVAAAKAAYPRQMEKEGVAATLDAVFVPATGAVTFRDVKAGIAIGSNVPRTHPFTEAVSDAYAAAIADLPHPDGISPNIAFVTPWRFAMLRGDDDHPTTRGGVSTGETTTGTP